MSDIEAALRALAEGSVHPDIGGIEERVFARTLAANRGKGGSTPLGLLTAVAAVALGVAGAGATELPSKGDPALWPFGPAEPLAPSTLLGSSLRR